MLGNGVTKKSVLATISAADSSPCFRPVMKVKAGTRREAFSLLISFKALKRLALDVPEATGHSPSAAAQAFAMTQNKATANERRIAPPRLQRQRKMEVPLLQ